MYLCVCLSVYTSTVCMEEPSDIRRGVKSPGPGVTGFGELPRGYWELNHGPCKNSEHPFNFQMSL